MLFFFFLISIKTTKFKKKNQVSKHIFFSLKSIKKIKRPKMDQQKHDYITQLAISKNPEIEEILKVESEPKKFPFFYFNNLFRGSQMKN